jgi:transposase
MLAATLDAIPPVRRRRKPGGRPRRRPTKLHANKSYDHRFCRAECRRRGIVPSHRTAWHPGQPRLGRHRWKVERTLAWMARFRRLTIRYERREDIHLAFTTLAAALICLSQVRRFC